jgi:triacylglycerol lipase
VSAATVAGAGAATAQDAGAGADGHTTSQSSDSPDAKADSADFIAQQMALRGGADNVSLYADSAGSLIAISAVRQLIRDGKPVPASIVLLSLVADSSLENPDIRDVDDPIFDLETAQDVFASHWCDGITDREDPSVSPLFFEPEILAALPPTTIYVGEREILYPDTLLLQERAVEEGAPISVVVGTGLVHDWPSSGLSLIYSQTGAVRPDIYRHLGLTGDTTGGRCPAIPTTSSDWPAWRG